MNYLSIYDLLRFFDRSEFSNPDQMDAGFLLRLDFARKKAGVPFKVNSDFRAGDDGPHGEGVAVDLECLDSRTRYQMVKALLEVGFNRLGVYPRHVHVDLGEGPPEVFWHGTYAKEE